jgi:plasmid stabilization system protein ParE
MPDAYRVILTPEALADLEGIAEYIRQDSPANAAAMVETILDAMESLATMPRRCKRVGQSRQHRSPVHALLVRPYVVYYRIDESPGAVQILHIRHGRRRQPRRFE